MPMLDPAQQAAAIASMQTNNGPGAEMEEEDPTMGGTAPAPTLGEAAAPSPMDAGGAPTTDQIPTEGLAAMVGQDSGGQDPQVAEVIAAMEDPNTPPEVLQNIQAMLAMAARRRMAGV